MRIKYRFTPALYARLRLLLGMGLAISANQPQCSTAAILTFERDYSYLAATKWFAATNDLINAGQPTLLSTSFSGTALSPSSPSKLNDGSNGGFDGNAGSGFMANLGNCIWTVNLNGPTNVSRIVVYSGGDYNIAAQNYKLEYRVAGSGVYTTLFAALQQTWNNAPGASTAIKLTIIPEGTELQNIDSLRFTFPNGYPNYPKYDEIDVFAAVVPQPSDPFGIWQTRYFGNTNSPSASPYADADGDGMLNVNEFLAGFNPTNAAASLHFSSGAFLGTNLVATYLGADGDGTFSPGPKTNVLEFAPQLMSTTNWLGVATNVLTGGVGLGAAVTVTNPVSFTNQSGFYRVRVPIPGNGTGDFVLGSFESTADVNSWGTDSGVARSRSSVWSSSGTYSMRVTVPAAPWFGVSKTFSSITDWQNYENLEFDLGAVGSPVDYLTVALEFPGMFAFNFRVDKLAAGETRRVTIPIGNMDQLRSATNVTLRIYYSFLGAPVTFYVDDVKLTGVAPALRSVKELQSIVLARDASIRAVGDTSLNSRLSALQNNLASLAAGSAAYSQITYPAELANWNNILSDWSVIVLQGRGIVTPEYTVGFESPMHKFKKSDPIGLLEGDLSGNSISLSAARNEFESVQLVVAPLTKSITGVTVAASNLTGPAGNFLSQTNIEIRLVGEVDVSGTTLLETATLTGLWPDPLISYTTPVAVNLGSRQSIWVTVYAPKGQAPGLYQGTMTVTTANSHAYPINLAVNVRNFTLPDRSSLKTHFSLHSWPLRKFYSPSPLLDQDNLIGAVDAWDFEWDAPSFSTVSKWTAYARKYRLSLSSPLWWTEYDQRTNPYMWPVSASNGVVQFSQWNSLAASNLNGSANFMSVMGVSKSAGLAQQTNYIALMNQLLPQMQSNLIAKGWADLSCIYLPDEPAWGTIGTDFLSVATLLKGLAPNIKTLATMAPPHVHPDYSNVLSKVDIFCPLMDSCFTTINNGLRQSGKEVWWYPATIPFNPYPHLGVYQDGMDPRIIPWLTWKYKMDGLLYWGVNVFGDANINSSANPKWPARPWTMQGFHYNPGDGMLMYPGTNGQPWSSVRLENLRDGMEDFEYLALIEKGIKYLSISKPTNIVFLKAQTTNLLNGVTNLITTPINFTRQPQDVANYRTNMAGLLDQIAPPAITYVDDFSVSNVFAWLPSPASTATNWVMTTSSNQYQVDIANVSQTSVAMARKATLGISWEIVTDLKWVQSRNGGDAGYGLGGLILANSSTDPLNGDYLLVFMNRSTNNPTANFVRPAAEWRIGGVTGSVYPPFSSETTGENQYQLSVKRVGANLEVKLIAGGVAPMTFSINSIATANLDALTQPGLAGYLSVTKFMNFLVYEN